MARKTPSQKEEGGGGFTWARVRAILAGVALLFSIAGGAAVVGGGAIYLWVADLRGFALGVVGAGAILLVLALFSSFVTVRAALSGPRGRYTVAAVAIVVAFVVIAVLVNFISYRSFARWDVTATRQFDLAPQTLKVLKELKEPVKATAFFVPTRTDQLADRQRTDDLLFEFQRRSGRKVTYRFVDPEAEPGVAKQYAVTSYPAVVFEATESKKQQIVLVPPAMEQDFTSALLIVTGVEQKRVYFLTGHGEKDIRDIQEESSGFGFATRGILADNYRVVPLNLKLFGEVPEDVAVLVVAGPQRDLLEDEQEMLFNWLKAGGRAIFLLDPGAPQTFRDLLAKWGILVQKGTVVDVGSSITGDPRTALVQRSQYSPQAEITQPLDVTFYPQATGLTIPEEFRKDPRKQPPWVTYTPLAVTTFQSWLTEDKDRNTFDRAKDVRGPAVLAMAVQAYSTLAEEPQAPANPGDTRKATSIVVVGDSDFASNKYFSAYSNGDLLLNTVNWLAEDFALISIRPKAIVFRELVVTRREFDFIRYSSWFLLPAAVACLGLVAWWRRR